MLDGCCWWPLLSWRFSLPAIFDLVRRSSVKSDSNLVDADDGKTARQVAMSSLALSCLNVHHLVRYFFLDQPIDIPSTKTPATPLYRV